MYKTFLPHVSAFALTQALSISNSLNNSMVNTLQESFTATSDIANLLAQATLDDDSSTPLCFGWVAA